MGQRNWKHWEVKACEEILQQVMVLEGEVWEETLWYRSATAYLLAPVW